MKYFIKPHNILLRITLFLVFLIFSQQSLFAQNNFIVFSPDEKIDPNHPSLPKLSFQDNGTSYVELEYRFPGASISETTVNNTVYDFIHIEGFAKMKQIGKPALPSHIDIIAAPENAKFKIVIIETIYEELSAYMIHPALRPATDRYGDPEPPFVIDQKLYNTNDFFPNNIVEIVDQQMIRNIPLAFVQVMPVQFNPVSQKIKVYSQIKYRIEFIGTNLSFNGISQNNSLHHTQLLKNYMLNNSSIPDGISVTNTRSDHKDYIIVTHSNYIQAADSLAKWKEQLGYSVEIISKSSWTSAQIKDSVHSRYHSWTPYPDYLAIIGDHNLVPGEIHQDPSYGDNFATDLYYACMDGPGDFIADMAFGRISVASSSQALEVVQKIINYERSPVNDANFYNTGLNCAQFQDDNLNGYADRRFSLTSEDVLNYVSGTLGYTVNRVYKAESSVNPTNWNNGSYANGEPLPPFLLKPGFPWDGGPTDIQNEIENGAFFVLHRDHGYAGGSGWHRPYFVKSHIDNLSNGNKLPVVFSINCHTGEFQLSECFAEKFLRKTNGGAVGVIAAAYYSYSGLNDGFTLGLFDAIWSNPGLIPNFTGYGGIPNPTLSPHNDIFTMGDVLNQGLIRMAETWGQDLYTHELFHYFGDPAMKIWTSAPAQIMATHIDTLPCGSTSMTITGCNCIDAIATLYYNNTLIGSTQLTSGSGTIIFDTVNNPSLTATLTISGHNYIPYFAELPIGSCNIPPVADFTVSDTTATICGTFHSVVSFTDLSINIPNFWQWSFVPSTITFVNGTNSNSKNPQVSFNAPGLYSVSLMAQNAFGGDTKIKYDYIDVNEIIGISLPFTEDFESGSFSTNSWTIDNPDGNISWDIGSPVPGNSPGTNSAFLNFYNYGNVGAKDAIISPELNFSGHNSIILNFKHAYTRYESSVTDSLIIYVSIDCGTIWERVRAFGEDGSGNFATAPDPSFRSFTQFVPSSVNDWCGNGVGSTCYDINLSQWVGNKSVKVKFESYCSYGNNLFIDDINIEADAYGLSADFIASDTIICAGESIDFIDMSSGLVNTWAWEFEGGTPTISNQQNPTSIIYYVPGVYDVKLIIGNGVNTDTIIKTDYITVNSLPQISTSNDTIICSGECVTLSASGGISYLWSIGNLTYYINVCPTTNTTYSVTITDNNGCTNSDEIGVIVNDNPGAYISGTKTICEGVCTDLLALPPAGVTYSWSTGESSNSINVCPTDSTIYTVTVTDNNGCAGSYDAAVNVNPVPLVDAGADKTITQGHSTTLTATTTGGQGPTYTYVWSTGDQAAQISVFPSATTTYTVTVTDMNGCTDSDDVHVQVNAQIPSIITRVEPLAGLYCPGDPVVVQISATNIYNVGSFSLVLNYDTTVLSYQGYTANPGLAVGILLVNNVAFLEQVRMTCFTIFTPINIGNDILLEYSFIHKGSSCDLTWNTLVQGDCEYNDASSQQLPLPSAFINGNITGSSGPQASAGSDKSVYQGSCTLLTASGGGTYTWSNGDQTANTVVCPSVTSTYTVTVTDANGCSASDDVIVTVNSIPTTNVELQGKVILQGAYAGSGIMNTLICQADSFPHSQPFNTSPWNYTGMEQISSVPANVVDWVLIEIRDSNDVNIVHEYKAGLLLNNGQIVDTNFTTGINLTTISAAYYYVVIRHLNHLPLMTANPVMLPNTVVLDFSDTTNTPLYGSAINSAIEVEANVFAMIGGDINSDGTLKYSGPGNDRGLILQKIINESGSTIITTILSGYNQEDITLDGKLKYSGPGNDPSLIIQNLVNMTGSTSITVIFTTPVPNP